MVEKSDATKPYQVCPESIAYLIAKRLTSINEADAGVAILLLYDTYTRAAELKAIKTSDVLILPEDNKM